MTPQVTTTGVACSMLSTPLWLQTVNPYLQFGGLALGALWIAVQLYYKIRNESFKRKDKSSDVS